MELYIRVIDQSFVLFDLFSVDIDFGPELWNFVDSAEVKAVSVVDWHVGLDVFVLLDTGFGLE